MGSIAKDPLWFHTSAARQFWRTENLHLPTNEGYARYLQYTISVYIVFVPTTLDQDFPQQIGEWIVLTVHEHFEDFIRDLQRMFGFRSIPLSMTAMVFTGTGNMTSNITPANLIPVSRALKERSGYIKVFEGFPGHAVPSLQASSNPSIPLPSTGPGKRQKSVDEAGPPEKPAPEQLERVD